MTNDLDGIKEGDRVRVTMEGEVQSVDGDFLAVVIVKGEGNCIFTAEERRSPGFKLERIEAPLQIGDRVTLCAREDDLGIGEIQAIWESVAWVSFKGDLPFNCVLQNLTRVAP